MVVKKTIGDIIFDTANVIVLTAMMLVTLYPCLYVLFASISDPVEIAHSSGLLLWPKGLQFGAYPMVFDNRWILIGYKNTILYLIVGTSVNLLLTLFGAYALSRKGLYGKNICMFLIVFTMFFNGGMIPTFLLNKSLGFYNNLWAVIVPFAINVFNLIIMRTFFASIPESMEESAKIDGANDFIILFRIMVPLALPVIAVVGLYYGVEHWNSYMRAVIYLNKRQLFPLQLILREILLQNFNNSGVTAVDNAAEVAENIKYATIIVSTVPILFAYPFLQRFFVKGIMVGAIKG